MVKVAEHSETEKKILDAARSVFIKKGMYGARMQEIADEAGINKALLHYYFRNKNKLFDAVFIDTASQFIPNLVELLDSESSLEEKIQGFVSYYIDMLWQNPYLPVFIINEIHQDPERLKLMAGVFKDIKNTSFFKQMGALALQSDASPTMALHKFINLASVCVFPVLAAPMVGHLFDMDKKQLDSFFEERKKVVPRMILSMLQLDKT